MISALECLKNNKYSGGFRQVSKEQAKVIELKWPLETGWKDTVSRIMLTEEQAEYFKKFDIDNRKENLLNRFYPVSIYKRTDVADWKITSVNFYQSREWRELRYVALRKHGSACQCCGRSPEKHGVVLHVDHIIPRSLDPTRALDGNNLQVLCEDCNLGKSNKDMQDWRPTQDTLKSTVIQLQARRTMLQGEAVKLTKAIRRMKREIKDNSKNI